MAETGAAVGVTLSLGEIIACFASGKMLTFMWVLINAVQILVFLGIWQILYPDFIKIVLSELRRVSWGEYLDDLEIGKRMNESVFGSDD